MSASVLCIGTELTRGEIVNTNATWLAGELTAIGYDVVEVTVVDDDPSRIVATLERLAAQSRVIVATGGLGPTTDDLTAAAVARAMGVALERHQPSIEAIRRRFEGLGRKMSPSNEKQADVPRGADVLPNPVGTAPGFAVTIAGARAYFLPGVPREMKRLYADHVAPQIAKTAPNLTYQIRLKTFGLPESVVGEKLSGVEVAFPGITIGYRAHFPEIEVKIHARADSHADAQALATRAAIEVRGRLGDIVYGEGDDTFPVVVGRAVRNRGWRLAMAESCTGGLVGQLLTREPASDFFVGGAVTYANSAKSRLLGVSEEVLRGHGAVSGEVAAAMAEGARRLADCEIAFAITGIAGPGGGTPEKPIGLVYWAVAHPGGTVVRERVFSGDRTQIQMFAAFAALALVREICLAKHA
jgi:nicotinamide-nucleotide amidase